MKIKQNTLEQEIRSGDFSFQDSFQDIEQLHQVNEESIKLLLTLRTVNQLLIKEERAKLKKETLYKRAYNKAYLDRESAKNETQRKLLAELDCEKEELELAKSKQMIVELNRLIQHIKIELDTLKMLSFNLRQELQ